MHKFIGDLALYSYSWLTHIQWKTCVKEQLTFC